MTGMELLEFLAVLITTGMILVVITRYFAMQENIARLKASKEARISVQNRNNAQMRGKAKLQDEEPEPQIGDWVPALLEGFGINPDVIFEDEMPQELKTFLPIVKGYINAQGGIGGVAQQLQKGTQGAGDDSHKAI